MRAITGSGLLSAAALAVSLPATAADMTHGRLGVVQIHGGNSATANGIAPTLVTVLGQRANAHFETRTTSARGDIAVDFVDGSEDVLHGIPIITVLQNARDNSAGFTLPQEPAAPGDHYGISSFFEEVEPESGEYMLATFTGDMFKARSWVDFSDELNINVNAGFFPFDHADFLAGSLYSVPSGFEGNPGIGLGSELLDLGSGFLLNLDSHGLSECDGVVLANSGRNRDDTMMVRASGLGFEMFAFRATTQQVAQVPFGFVFIPDGHPDALIGRYSAGGLANCLNNPFIQIEQLGVGTFELSHRYSTYTPENSTLLLTATMSDILVPRFVTAEPGDDHETWIVQVRELGSGELIDVPNAEELFDYAVLPD